MKKKKKCIVCIHYASLPSSMEIGICGKKRKPIVVVGDIVNKCLSYKFDESMDEIIELKGG